MTISRRESFKRHRPIGGWEWSLQMSLQPGNSGLIWSITRIVVILFFVRRFCEKQLKWIHRGNWQLRRNVGAAAVDYLAVLPVVAASGRRQRMAAKAFFSNHEKWRREIGDRAGLLSYTVTRGKVLEQLAAMSRLVEKFEYEFASLPLEDCDPHRRRAILRGLLRLLRKYGPVHPIRGVVDVVSGGDSSDGLEKGVVSLDDLIEDVARFGHLYGQVRDLSVDHALLAQQMYHECGDDFRDLRVEVAVIKDEIRFVTRPITLRAYLWETLFDMNSRIPGTCNLCKEPFSPRSGPGRPWEYCEYHRGTRYRTAAYELREAKRASRNRANVPR